MGGGEVFLEGGAVGNRLSVVHLLKKTCVVAEWQGGDRSGLSKKRKVVPPKGKEGKGKEKRSQSGEDTGRCCCRDGG